MPTKWQINNAVKASNLPPPSRLIMLVLSDAADAKTGIIPEDRGPALRDIAGWTGLSKATVVRHLDLLEESGWVVRDRPTTEAARREHARTGYRLDTGPVSQGDKPVSDGDMPNEDNLSSLSHGETSQSGQDGNSMSHSETGHVSQRDQSLSHSETVPYTDKEETIKNTSTSANASKPKRRPSKPKDTDRPDVERICNHLADRIAADGTKRPTITAKWRTEARLLLDRDGRTVEQVLKAIDWCQNDPFWRANILSMPKLRKQYETLRRHAQRPNGRASPRRPELVEHNGLMLKPETVAELERSKRFEAMDKQQAAALAIEGPQ